MRGTLEWLSLCRRGRRYLPLYSALTAAGAALLPRPLSALSALALTAPWLTLAAERAWPEARTTNLRGASPETLIALTRVEIDERLLRAAPAVSAVYLPFDTAPDMPLRQRPGALLLASAATVTLSLLDEEAQGAVRGAMKAIGFTPEQFLARCPLRGEARVGEMTGLVTRDGRGQRAYFMAEPARLLPACRLILDGDERDVIGADIDRLKTCCSADRLYGYATAPVTEEGIGPLTYLGALTVAALPMPEAQRCLTRLRAAGLTAEGCEACAPLKEGVLRITPEEGEGLRLIARAGEDFAAPVLSGMEAARRMDGRLCRAGMSLLACFCLAAWLPQGAWLLAAALALRPGMIAPLTARSAPRRKGLALAWAAAASLGLWRFLCYTGSAAAPACMPLALFGAAAWLGPWLCGTVRERCISLAVAVAGAVAACLALSPPVLPGAFCLLAGVALALAYSRLLSRRRAG